MKRIVLIKLGALGDVIRTLPLAKAIKKTYPDSELTWITKNNAKSVIELNQNINNVKTLPFSPNEDFDILYNFDIEDEVTTLAKEIKAKEKFGFASEGGFISTFNLGAEYYLNTLFDDEIKKSNTKTYQEMMFLAAELPYEKEPYKIVLTSQEKANTQKFKEQNNLLNKKVIGIHIGSSPRWPSKAWNGENIKYFIKKAKEKGYEIILFAGPDEPEKQEQILNSLGKEGIKILKNNPDNSIREFISLVSACDYMVCSDSLALHVAVGLQKPTVALFFCTPPEEVEGYGFLTKLSSPMLTEFFPERMDEYSEELTKSISADQVFKELNLITSHYQKNANK